MKTLLICAKSKLADHVGEEYDDYFTVADQPDVKQLEIEQERIQQVVRGLWFEDQKDDEEPEKKVLIYLDGASPYNAVLIDFQVKMKDKEEIVIELPYLDEGKMRFTDDENYKPV